MQIFKVDAFTDSLFSGNPAAVVIVNEQLSSDLMQKIAMENNLSETAFIRKKSESLYDIRWFGT